MDESKKFEKVIKIETEFLPNRARIYTFIFEDGSQRHFIVTPEEIRTFLKNTYNQKYVNGEVFDPSEFEDKRSEYLENSITSN